MMLAFSGVVLAQQDRAAQDTKTLPERASKTAEEAIPGSYVVTLKDDIDQRPKDVANDLARRHGFSVKHNYENALKGFSARLSDQQVDRLKADSQVANVEEDTVMEAFQASSRQTPSGYERSGANQSPTSKAAAQGTSLGVDVAVLDSGIDLDHPDLAANVKDGTDCIQPGTSADDDNGHGSHVAGTIGAKPDTTNGVVGIATGTPVHAVKVLDSSGSGSLSTVLCGIDYVTGKNTDKNSDGTANKANDIEVVNMSLGGGGSDSTVDSNCLTPASAKDSYHEAICRSVKSGATYVVAAGNGSTNFSATRPATYKEVLTVTNEADYDGVPGSKYTSSKCTSDGDNTARDTSNYSTTGTGTAATEDRGHLISAPGTCIKSTHKDGGYALMTGTSMASPHVAGAAALLVYKNPGITPEQVKQQLMSQAKTKTGSKAGSYYTSPYYGFNNDPNYPMKNTNRYYGYLLWTGAL
jgi:subtilisin family serine protease